MSNVFDRHSVTPFKAGSSKAISGQRLAKVGYKTTKKQTAKFASVCASVPMIEAAQIESNITTLIPHVRSMLESAQDGIFRSLYESADGHLDAITDADLSVESCIAFLVAEATGERIKKETILAWFDEELADNLFVLIAEKLGFEEPNEAQTATIKKHLTGYRDVFAVLAGGKTMLDAPKIRGCRTALSLTDCDDGIGKKLIARLDAMEQKAEKMHELLEL